LVIWGIFCIFIEQNKTFIMEYTKSKRGGIRKVSELSIPKTLIKCKGCNTMRDSTHYFWIKKGKVVTLNSRTCRKCINEDVRINARHKKTNPSPKNSKCECCGRVANLHCDHSHNKSKKFRGWICGKCNTGIGMLGDSVVGVRRALKYLQKL
jgi:hypothetical protein